MRSPLLIPGHQSRLPGPGRVAPALLLTAAALALLVTGCKPVGPNYKRPGYTAPPAYKEANQQAAASNVVAPPPAPDNGAWKPADPSDGMLRGKWWETYNDPQLNKLEERIATYNQGLHAAMENYLAAREQVAIARANYYPTLSLNPGFSHEKLSDHRPLISQFSHISQYNDITLEGQASWEPDFWGRIRRTVENVKAAAQASNADMANIDLSLHSEMAEDYFQLRGLDLSKKLLERNIQDLTGQVDLTTRRFKGGVGTEADVDQAQSQLDSVRAQLIDLGVARAQYEHAIGTIADIKLPDFSIPDSPLDLESTTDLPKIPLGVPSQLLERRPDIAAAERRAAQANANIGIAVAAFYPTITLSGGGGFESTHAGTLLQGPSSLWTLGGQAAQLLLDGGRRRAVTAQARDQYEAQASNYKGSVFLAFQEVEDKLSDLRILEQERVAQHQAVLSAHKFLDIANTRYKGGVTSYIEVLTAENTYIQNQKTEADLKRRQFAASIELIRALGGGWDTSQIPK